MTVQRSLTLGGAALAALVLTACGGAAQGGTGGDAAAGCSTALTITAGGAEFTATHAVAASLEGGRAYTAYVADAALNEADVTILAGPASSGDVLATISLTRFNAENPPVIESGTTIPADAPWGELTFVVTVSTGGRTLGDNTGGEGDVTVTEVGGTLCFEIDYSDSEKSLSGTVAASVKEL